MLIINNLSDYKSNYIFSKVATPLAVKDLSDYTNVKVDFTEENEENEEKVRLKVQGFQVSDLKTNGYSSVHVTMLV